MQSLFIFQLLFLESLVVYLRWVRLLFQDLFPRWTHMLILNLIYIYYFEFIYICRVPEVDPYQSTIGAAMLYQKSTFGTMNSCTRCRSTSGTVNAVPEVDRLLGQPLSLYQSTIGTAYFQIWVLGIDNESIVF